MLQLNFNTFFLAYWVKLLILFNNVFIHIFVPVAIIIHNFFFVFDTTHSFHIFLLHLFRHICFNVSVCDS